MMRPRMTRTAGSCLPQGYMLLPLPLPSSSAAFCLPRAHHSADHLPSSSSSPAAAASSHSARGQPSPALRTMEHQVLSTHVRLSNQFEKARLWQHPQQRWWHTPTTAPYQKPMPPGRAPSWQHQQKRHHGSLAQRLPKGSWDSHMHVLDPDNYQLVKGAAYRPNTFRPGEALSFESSVGIDNMVLVQPSIYGYDNSCLLDALRQIGPERARGVIAFDPATTTPEQLREWHELGVRGVRFNVQSNGQAITPEELSSSLNQYADLIRPLGWVLQLYIPMSLIQALEPIVPSLNITLCIDHLGCPDLTAAPSSLSAADPYSIPGFASLARTLERGTVFVKLSAPYRLSTDQGYSDLDPVAREILRLRGKSRVVFATDWPHTRFEGWDVRPWMERVLGWCGGDAELVERLFRGNAEDLWGS